VFRLQLRFGVTEENQSGVNAMRTHGHSFTHGSKGMFNIAEYTLEEILKFQDFVKGESHASVFSDEELQKIQEVKDILNHAQTRQ
jgi:hypothetical protein